MSSLPNWNSCSSPCTTTQTRIARRRLSFERLDAARHGLFHVTHGSASRTVDRLCEDDSAHELGLVEGRARLLPIRVVTGDSDDTKCDQEGDKIRLASMRRIAKPMQ